MIYRDLILWNLGLSLSISWNRIDATKWFKWWYSESSCLDRRIYLFLVSNCKIGQVRALRSQSVLLLCIWTWNLLSTVCCTYMNMIWRLIYSRTKNKVILLLPSFWRPISTAFYTNILELLPTSHSNAHPVLWYLKVKKWSVLCLMVQLRRCR